MAATPHRNKSYSSYIVVLVFFIIWGGAKHTSMLLQAQLEGGEWVQLLGTGHPGIAETKWCANRFTPFMCIGPSPAAKAGEMDAEEFIEVPGNLLNRGVCTTVNSDNVCRAVALYSIL